MIGTSFGPYRIEGLLGRGGMGEVYRAVDTSQADRVVALKVLAPALSADPPFVARFRREAEIAARVSEPHIVPVHRYGAIDGRLFLDMQLVEGRELGTAIALDGPLTPERAVAILEQVGAALDATHAEGLVHRDIKPSNILLTDGGNGQPEFAYLLDFGIANHTEPGSRTVVTRTGSVVGTLAYMAPERFLARNTGPAADVYALACVLHEMLTGSRPYPADGHEAQIEGHLRQPPPRPSSSRAGIPLALDAVVARGMAKSPDARPRSAGDLALVARAALVGPRSGRPEKRTAPVLRHTPTLAVSVPLPVSLPVPPQPRTRWWIGALATFGAILLATALVVTLAVMPGAARSLADPATAPPTATTPVGPSAVLPSADRPITERTLVGRGSFRPPAVADLDGRPVLVVTDFVKPAVVLDLATGDPIGKPVTAGLAGFTSATVTMLDGKPVLVTGGTDNVIRLWDLQTGAALPQTLTGHTGAVGALVMATVDGKVELISAGDDLTVRRWDVASGQQLGTPISGLGKAPSALSVTDVGGRPVVLSAGGDWTVHAWDLASGAPVGAPVASRTLDPAAITLPDGRTGVLAQDGGTYSLLDVTTGAVVATGNAGYVDALRPVVVSGRALLAVAEKGVIQLLDVRDGTPVGTPMTGHEAAVSALTSVDVHGSTYLISTSSSDRSVRIWDLTTRARG